MSAFSLTAGGCSCGFINPKKGKLDTQAESARLRKKYKKLKWSESKIERAISDHLKNNRVFNETRSPIQPEIAEFLDLELKRCKRIQFICHWHSDSFLYETFNVVDRTGTSIASLQSKGVDEDIRYDLEI